MKKWLSLLLAAALSLGGTAVVSAKQDSSQKQQLESKEKYEKHKEGKDKDKGKGKDKDKKKEKATGTISAVDAAAKMITLSTKGKTIDIAIDDNTKIKINEIKNPAVDDIWKGDKAVIEFVRDQSVNTAKKIEITRKKEVIKGTVKEVNTEQKTIAVDRKVVLVTDKTEIRMEGEELTFADILAEDKVVVTGFKREKEVVAVKIQVKREAIKLEGHIESINAADKSVTIAGKVVKVDEKTKIVAEDEPIPFDKLQVNAEVKAFIVKRGEQYLAIKIIVKEPEDEDDEDDNEEPVDVVSSVEGLVEAVDATAKNFTVNGTVVQVTDTTKYQAEDGTPLTFDDVKPGVKTKVEGTKKENCHNRNHCRCECAAAVKTKERHPLTIKQRTPFFFRGKTKTTASAMRAARLATAFSRRLLSCLLCYPRLCLEISPFSSLPDQWKIDPDRLALPVDGCFFVLICQPCRVRPCESPRFPGLS